MLRIPDPTTRPFIAELLARRSEFLAFLENQTHDRAFSEDVLQDAYTRAATAISTVREEAATSSWFYQLLRNALVDHIRRRGARERAHARAANELEEAVEPDVDRPKACGCVGRLAGALDPQHREIVQRIDVEGISIAAYAADHGITANNARVRLHRARAVLRATVLENCGGCAETGCADCSCAVAKTTTASCCGSTRRCRER